MRKNYNIEDLKVLSKVLGVAMETAVEVIEKKKAFAFINNAFTIISVGGELKELGEEVKHIQQNPDLLVKLEAELLKKYRKHENDIILKTCRKIYAAIIYNVSTGLSIGEDWREHNETKEEKPK